MDYQSNVVSDFNQVWASTVLSVREDPSASRADVSARWVCVQWYSSNFSAVTNANSSICQMFDSLARGIKLCTYVKESSCVIWIRIPSHLFFTIVRALNRRVSLSHTCAHVITFLPYQQCHSLSLFFLSCFFFFFIKSAIIIKLAFAIIIKSSDSYYDVFIAYNEYNQMRMFNVNAKGNKQITDTNARHLHSFWLM